MKMKFVVFNRNTLHIVHVGFDDAEFIHDTASEWIINCRNNQNLDYYTESL